MNLSDFERLEVIWIDRASDFINNYVIRIVGCLGILFNFFFAVMLTHKSLRHKIYDFFWCRVICNLISSMFAAGYLEKCFVCDYETFWFIFYQYYINSIGLRVVSFASLAAEILLILNRFSVIIKKDKFLTQMSKKTILFLCFSIPLLSSVPGYFSVEIVAGSKNGTFVKKLTKFGASNYFFYYYTFLFLMETVIPIVILVFLNSVSVYKFKKIMDKKGHLTKNQTEGKQAEIRFCILIFTLTTICILSRLLDFGITLPFRLTILNPNLFEPRIVKLLGFLKCLTNLFLYSTQALDGILYLKMDSNLWKLIIKTLGCKKVRPNFKYFIFSWVLKY